MDKISQKERNNLGKTITVTVDFKVKAEMFLDEEGTPFYESLEMNKVEMLKEGETDLTDAWDRIMEQIESDIEKEYNYLKK